MQALRIVVTLAGLFLGLHLLWKALDAGRLLRRPPDAPVDISPLARHYEMMASAAALFLAVGAGGLLAGRVLTPERWWLAPLLWVACRALVAAIVRLS